MSSSRNAVASSSRCTTCTPVCVVPLEHYAADRARCKRPHRYRGRSKSVFKIAIQKVEKALQQAYRDRKVIHPHCPTTTVWAVDHMHLLFSPPYKSQAQTSTSILTQKVPLWGLCLLFPPQNKKRDFRRLWIERINAGVRQHGMSYSMFINHAKKADVDLNRKVG